MAGVSAIGLGLTDSYPFSSVLFAINGIGFTFFSGAEDAWAIDNLYHYDRADLIKAVLRQEPGHHVPGNGRRAPRRRRHRCRVGNSTPVVHLGRWLSPRRSRVDADGRALHPRAAHLLHRPPPNAQADQRSRCDSSRATATSDWRSWPRRSWPCCSSTMASGNRSSSISSSPWQESDTSLRRGPRRCRDVAAHPQTRPLRLPRAPGISASSRRCSSSFAVPLLYGPRYLIASAMFVVLRGNRHVRRTPPQPLHPTAPPLPTAGHGGVDQVDDVQGDHGGRRHHPGDRRRSHQSPNGVSDHRRVRVRRPLGPLANGREPVPRLGRSRPLKSSSPRSRQQPSQQHTIHARSVP